MAALMGVLTVKLVIVMTILLQSYAMQAQPNMERGGCDETRIRFFEGQA